MRGHRIWNPFEWVGHWKEQRAIKKFEERQKLFIEEEEDFNEAVDSILEKIKNEGIQSLTSQEKAEIGKGPGTFVEPGKSQNADEAGTHRRAREFSRE